MVRFKTQLFEDHRKAQGLSIVDLAAKAGIHALTYARTIKSENPNPVTVRKIAEALGMPMSEVAEIVPDEDCCKAS